MERAVIVGLLISILAGLTARSVLPSPRPPVLLAGAAGVTGMVLGAPVAHRISSGHEFHAFQPESFIAGFVGALLILLVVRRIARRLAPDDRRLFS